MNESDPRPDIVFRLGLLERATAENTRRLGELTQALAALGGTNRPLTVPAPRAITLDADSVAPFAAGFYSREVDSTGKPYRWTGRGDFFEFRFALDRNIEWTFELDLLGNKHVSLALLRAFVDYAEVPIESGASGEKVCGAIPIRILSNLIVMTFYLPAKFVPSQLDPAAADHRTLSAVFYGLKLVPLAGADKHPTEMAVRRTGDRLGASE